MINKKLNNYINFISIVLLIIYLIVLFNRVFFYAYSSYYRTPTSVNYNLIPFKTVFNFIKSYNSLNFDIWFFNLFGNVIAFMPFGFLLPSTFRKESKTKYVVLSGFLLSLLIETLQIITRLGSFDIDDLILNSLGVYIGWLCYRVILRILNDL